MSVPQKSTGGGGGGGVGVGGHKRNTWMDKLLERDKFSFCTS